MTRLKIEGMTCNHCVMAVRQALEAVPGVRGRVEVSLDPGAATVDGDAPVEALLAAVADEGYVATVAEQPARRG
jgi:copper chaperone